MANDIGYINTGGNTAISQIRQRNAFDGHQHIDTEYVGRMLQLPTTTPAESNSAQCRFGLLALDQTHAP